MNLFIDKNVFINNKQLHMKVMDMMEVAEEKIIF